MSSNFSWLLIYKEDAACPLAGVMVWIDNLFKDVLMKIRPESHSALARGSED
jgi:hypothetical protein